MQGHGNSYSPGTFCFNLPLYKRAYEPSFYTQCLEFLFLCFLFNSVPSGLCPIHSTKPNHPKDTKCVCYQIHWGVRLHQPYKLHCVFGTHFFPSVVSPHPSLFILWLTCPPLPPHCPSNECPTLKC